MTTSLYYTPSGKSIQAHGIEPDIIVNSAKIEKDSKISDRDSEADLKNHLEVQIQKEIEDELRFLKTHNYAYAILGCTHYPLVRDHIENFLNIKTISPDAHVATRVVDLTVQQRDSKNKGEDFFYYLSSTDNQWTTMKRESFLGPFRGK